MDVRLIVVGEVTPEQYNMVLKEEELVSDGKLTVFSLTESEWLAEFARSGMIEQVATDGGFFAREVLKNAYLPLAPGSKLVFPIKPCFFRDDLLECNTNRLERALKYVIETYFRVDESTTVTVIVMSDPFYSDNYKNRRLAFEVIEHLWRHALGKEDSVAQLFLVREDGTYEY